MSARPGLDVELGIRAAGGRSSRLRPNASMGTGSSPGGNTGRRPLGSGLRTCLRQPEHVCPHRPLGPPDSLAGLEPALRIDLPLEALPEATPSRQRHRLAAVTCACCEAPYATPGGSFTTRHWR